MIEQIWKLLAPLLIGRELKVPLPKVVLPKPMSTLSPSSSLMKVKIIVPPLPQMDEQQQPKTKRVITKGKN